MPTFTSDYEEGLKAYSMADEAEATLVDMGLSHAERPISDAGKAADLPNLPDLSECGPDELAHWISILATWYNYANGRLTYFSKALNDATEKKSFAWSYLRKHCDGTVSDKDDTVKTDSRYVQVNSNYNYLDHVVKDLRCIVDNLDRSIKAASRVGTLLEYRLNVEGYSAATESKEKRRHDVLSGFVKRGRK
jgi:hypothetical protein